MSDEARFEELCDAMKLMRIDADAQMTVFKVIAGVMHIGNIKFVENEASYSDLTPATRKWVKSAASLFSLSEKGLYERLTSRTVRVVC